MKKKLLTSAAIASFLTAAGVVIPQTDIFAVDTPNTPHPSTLPSDKPSTIPNEQPSENTNSTENNGLVKEWHKIYDKKKVDSFADYWIESITRDKNYLTIKTKDHNSVDYVHYVDAEKIPTQWDAPGAHMLNATKIADDLYRVDTNELVKGENENKKFILNAISLVPDYSDDKNNYTTQNSNILKKYKDSNGNIKESFAYAAVEELDFKDLHKYADITRVVGPKATVENKQKSPEVGDKDYVVYTDKSQVELNGTIKTTIKYKPGVKKYSDVLIEKYVGKTSDGKLGFENIYGYISKDFVISFANDKDDKDDKELNLPGWYSMDSEGNDVFYTWLKGVAPGHYHITKLFGLDLTKGNLDNSEFTIGENEKFVYRTESDSTKPKDSNPIIEPTPTPQPEKPSETPKPGKEETLKPGETPKPGKEETLKPGETPKPGKEEILKPSETPKAGKEETLKPSETPKPGKEETLKPSETPKPGKEETLKPSETPKPGKEETLKPSETPKPGKEETLKPSETPKPGKEETLKLSETPQPAKPEGDKNTGSNWNPFAQGEKAKEGSTEVKSEAGEVAAKPVSNRKEGKALPNTGLQTTSYGFLAAIVGLFGAVALRRKSR